MTEPQFVMVFITAASTEEASKIARAVVDERLAACCNIVNPVTSIYRWEGKVMEDPEALMIVKTRSALLEPLIKRVKELHSYDVPEVISVALGEGNPAYMKWLADSTGEAENG